MRICGDKELNKVVIGTNHGSFHYTETATACLAGQTNNWQNFSIINEDGMVEISISPISNEIAIGIDNGFIGIFDIEEENITKSVKLEHSISCILYSKEGDLLFTGHLDGVIRIWEVSSFRIFFCLKDSKDAITSMVINEGNFLLSGSYDKCIKFWDINCIRKGGYFNIIESYKENINCISFSPKGGKFSTVGFDKRVRIYDSINGKIINNYSAHDDIITFFAWSNSGKKFATAGYDLTIKIWSCIYQEFMDEDYQPDYFSIENQYEKPITCVEFDNNGDYLAVGSHEKILKVWFVQKGTNELFSFDLIGHEKGIYSLKFSKENLLYSGSSDCSLKVWCFPMKECLYSFKSSSTIIKIIINPKDTNQFATLNLEKKVNLWNLEEDCCIWQSQTISSKSKFSNSGNFINNLVFDIDGKNLFTLDHGTILRLPLFSQERIEVLHDFGQSPVINFDFCPSEKKFAVLTEDNKLMLISSEKIFEYTEAQRILEIFENEENLEVINEKLNEIYGNDFSILNTMRIHPFNQTLLHYFVYLENLNNLTKFLKISKRNRISLDISTDVFNLTPFDIALKTENRTISSKLVEFCIISPPKLNCFQNFTENFQKLVEMQIPRIHELIDSRIFDITPKENEIYSEYLSESKTQCFNSLAITNEQLNLMMNNDLKRKTAAIKSSLCEFKVLDMSNALDFDCLILRTIRTLPSNHPIYESEAIDYILRHKWKNYGFILHCRRTLSFFLFTIILGINSLKFFPDRIQINPNEIKYKNLSIAFNSVFLIVCLIYISNEFKQAARFGWKIYFIRGNILDILCILLILTESLLDFLNITKVIKQVDLLKFTHSITLGVILIKLLSYLRGFKGTAFMIKMINQVFIDFRYFFIIMIFLNVALAFSAYLIQKDYKKMSRWTVIKGLYSLTIGDTNSFNDIETDLSFYKFLIFLVSSSLMVIILLNLVISVISETYGNVSKAGKLAYNYQKNKIISDVDYMRKNMKKKKYIGKYLVIGSTVREDIVQEDSVFSILKNKISKLNNSLTNFENETRDLKSNIYKLKKLAFINNRNS